MLSECCDEYKLYTTLYRRVSVWCFANSQTIYLWANFLSRLGLPEPGWQYPFRVIWRWIISWPWNLGYGSLEVVANAPFDISRTSSYLSSTVTIGRMLYRFRDKARYWSKTPIVHTSFILTFTDHDHSERLEFISKIVTQTALVPKL